MRGSPPLSGLALLAIDVYKIQIDDQRFAEVFDIFAVNSSFEAVTVTASVALTEAAADVASVTATVDDTSVAAVAAGLVAAVPDAGPAAAAVTGVNAAADESPSVLMVYVRDEFTAVQDLLLRRMAQSSTRTFLSGTPGIGKSLFVAYVLLPEVWRRRTELGIDWILYQYHEILYIIGESGIDEFGSGNYWVSNFDPRLRRMVTVLDTRSARVLLDRVAIKWVRHLLLVGSPAASSSAYHYLSKELPGVKAYFMKPLSCEELLHMGRRLGRSEEVVRRRFDTCGGSARLVLCPEPDDVDPMDLMGHTLKTAVRKQSESENACVMLMAANRGDIGLFDKSFANAISHHVFHLFPDPNTRSAVDFRVASPGLALALGVQMKENGLKDLLGMFLDAWIYKKFALAGGLWESYVTCYLIHGTSSISVRCQQKRFPNKWNQTGIQLEWDKLNSVRRYTSPFKETLEDGVLYVPLSLTEPVIDFLWVAHYNTTFDANTELDANKARDAGAPQKKRILVCGQATIAKTHSLKNSAAAFQSILAAAQASAIEFTNVLVALVPIPHVFKPMVPANAELWQSQKVIQSVWVHASGAHLPSS